MGRPDVLVVSVDSTSGWRSSARELTAALGRAGAVVESAIAGPVPQVRTFALTDWVQSRAARAAATRAIASAQPRAIVYCSGTAALLWPRPGAIWVDSLAAENRPGRHGLWQRPLERRRLAQAPLVLAMSERSLDPLVPGRRPESVLVRSPVEPSAPSTSAAAHEAVRDIDVLAYAADPRKRRLDFILSEWARARRGEERLVVTGIARPVDQSPSLEGVEWAGRLAPEEYRALLRRTRVFVTAPRHEDYGIAALEALADGALLVTTPADGPYPALALARELDRRLVSDDLAAALRVALDDPRDGYALRARSLVAPFGRDALDRVLAREVLPRLLGI